LLEKPPSDDSRLVCIQSGFEWPDILYDKQMVRVVRASQYQRMKGITEAFTKKESSEKFRGSE